MAGENHNRRTDRAARSIHCDRARRRAADVPDRGPWVPVSCCWLVPCSCNWPGRACLLVGRRQLRPPWSGTGRGNGAARQSRTSRQARRTNSKAVRKGRSACGGARGDGRSEAFRRERPYGDSRSVKQARLARGMRLFTLSSCGPVRRALGLGRWQLWQARTRADHGRVRVLLSIPGKGQVPRAGSNRASVMWKCAHRCCQRGRPSLHVGLRRLRTTRSREPLRRVRCSSNLGTNAAGGWCARKGRSVWDFAHRCHFRRDQSGGGKGCQQGCT
mmetsp:Transcript_12597/g.32139  ORF Transcript_12597/g.32139 Transcript_12597/m.32139 type:complete len:273 (-) Transcript_12597:2024-2842(-)